MVDRSREAASLYSIAEGFLRDENIEDCIRESSRAVELFEELGNEGVAGLADALFMLVDAHRQLAMALQEKPQQALTLATDGLAKFRAAGNRRGEAQMLLALAEINHDKRGRKKRYESLEEAAQALEIFRSIEDRKSEAYTLLVMAMAHYKFFMYEDMLQESQSALDIIEDLGDKYLMGKALNLVGLSLSSHRRIDAAMEKGRAALLVWRELGLRRQEAIQSHAIAGWLLYARWPKKALVLAEQTLELFRSLSPAGLPGGVKYRREAMSVYMIIELMTELKQYKSALKFAQAAFDRFVEVDSKIGQGMVKDSMSRVYIALDKTDKAIEQVDEAREIADSLGDKKWSAKLLFGVAQAHMRGKATDEAIDTLDKTIALAHAAGDMQETQRLQQNLIDALLFRQRNPKAAQRVAKEAREMAQKSGDKRAEAMATLREGMVMGVMSKREEGIQLAKQAQELFQEAYWPRGEAQCLQYIAEARNHMGDIEAALESAEERLAVLRELNDLTMEANALLQVANYHMKDQNFAEADKLAVDAQQLGKKDRNMKVQIEALLVITQVCATQIVEKPIEDKPSKPLVDRAVRSINEALQLAGKAENRALRAMVLYKRAETMVLARRHQAALRDVKEAALMMEEMGNYTSLGRALLLSGNIKHALGQVEQGLSDVDRAEQIAQDINDSNLANEVEAFRKALEERQQELEAKQRAPQVVQQQLEAGPVGAAPAAAQAAPEVSAAAPVAKGLDPEYVRKALATMVKDAIASEDDELELDSPFMDAGMDSLSSVALMSMVAKEFQMSLSPSLVFDFPTLRSMEEHLVAESKGM
eukprot:TRINITY_DN73105_c0_g1_i1.p1 TRINITY_DN73105_c0_g1~~TRINITY_DN73105_c0_g1_i1.p1  ORF type:complete len:818 (+),score=220.59 TRINITY_DN73105_c0_g1_i1:96-2549(+)